MTENQKDECWEDVEESHSVCCQWEGTSESEAAVETHRLFSDLLDCHPTMSLLKLKWKDTNVPKSHMYKHAH